VRKALALAVATIAVLGTAAVALATDQTTARQQASVKIATRTVPGLGRILVNAKGMTLYMFVPDKRRKVTCVKVCAAVWPPLKATKREKLVAGRGVKKALLGRDKNPAGGYVVTYDKWPLYTYVPDRKPGQATGQGLNSTGGLWYVLAPSGKVIKTKPHR
jgi:predicted lipoprotein with Yx(FWY)xxD motif